MWSGAGKRDVKGDEEGESGGSFMGDVVVWGFLLVEVSFRFVHVKIGRVERLGNWDGGSITEDFEFLHSLLH